MKKIFLFLFISLMLSISITQAGLMETVPVGEEVYGWIYDYLDELYARGFIKDLHMGTKPYFRDQIAKELLSLRDKIEKKQLLVGWPESFLLEGLETEFSDEINELKLKETSPKTRSRSKNFCGEWISKKNQILHLNKEQSYERLIGPMSKPRSAQTFSYAVAI